MKDKDRERSPIKTGGGGKADSKNLVYTLSQHFWGHPVQKYFFYLKVKILHVECWVSKYDKKGEWS